MNDPRKNLPSASRYERLILCPGSFAMERQCPEDPGSKWSERGSRIARIRAGEDVPEANDEERETAEMESSIERMLIARVFGDRAGEVTIIREKRYWLHGKGLKPIFSGQPDCVAILEKTALIIDDKSGRDDVTVATENKQLRALGVLIAQEHEVEQVIAAIGQPWVTRDPLTVEYGANELRLAEMELRHTLEIIRDFEAPRIAGEKQCRYCPAKAFCPEAQGSVATIPTPGALVTDQQLAQLLERCELAEHAIDAIKAEAKRRLAHDPEALSGWRLKPGAKESKIIDVQGVFSRLHERGVTAPQFAKACSLTKTNLKELLKATDTGLKGKVLDQAVAEVTDGFISEKVKAPTLERIKGAATETLTQEAA